MKKITLKRLSLVNFKGIRKFSADFNETTSIYGENGLGKTTIFDAFTWLLFGKDSQDRKQFNLRTLDENNRVIPNIPHEVTAVLDVNGEKVSLKRQFLEKWTKKKGELEEEYKGNEEKRFYNDVPCSLKEWNEKIEQICPEQVFKFITNPLYFTSQKMDVQRKMLIRMAGGVEDEEVAADNAQFKELLAKLTGKTMEEYKREVGAKKKRIKAEMDGMQERIDERKRDMPQEEDWKAIDNAIQQAREKVAEADKVLASESERMKMFNAEKKAAMEELGRLQKEERDLICVLESKLLHDYYQNVNKRNLLTNELDSIVSAKEQLKARATSILSQIATKEEELNKTREQWKKANVETINFNDGDFVCPTCKRPLEVEDIQQKQAEMTASFNSAKALGLTTLRNIGKAIGKEIEELKAKHEKIVASIAIHENKEKANREELATLPEVAEKPDTKQAIDEDKEINAVRNAMKPLEAKMAEEYIDTEKNALQAQKTAYQAELDGLVAKLGVRDVITANNKRIEELTNQYKSQSAELTELEGEEYVINEFGKAKINMVTNKINALFDFVKFKMYEQQINGGEVETCEAMVDGVPFSDLNSAGKINAGLDIINAICKSEKVSAPIVIDNAESVNKLHETESQIFRLVVSKDKELTIK